MTNAAAVSDAMTALVGTGTTIFAAAAGLGLIFITWAVLKRAFLRGAK